jgi:transposase
VSTLQNSPSGCGPARPTYSQDWASYNQAQTHEKELVAQMLHSLCSAIENPEYRRGRPRIPLADGVFAAVMKVYSGAGGRRTMTDIREYEARGFIDSAIHYNRIFEQLENPAVTHILKAMIEESARPLREIESDFAVDSSGFSTRVYRRWYDAKYGRERTSGDYVKAHVMVGTTTNVVTSVEVTPAAISDYQMFSPLVLSTAARFDMARVSADKAYSGRGNLALVDLAGAVPYIPFRSNAKPTGLPLWVRMYEFFHENAEEFYRHYHRRSNVETTFAMIKAKFGGFVRSKNSVAQVNEVLAKVLCHNLCCLVSAFYELGIAPEFWDSGTSALKAERLPAWFRNIPPRARWTGARKSGRGPVRSAPR